MIDCYEDDDDTTPTWYAAMGGGDLTGRACDCGRPATERVEVHHRRAPEWLRLCTNCATQAVAADVCACGARAVSRGKCSTCIRGSAMSKCTNCQSPAAPVPTTAPSPEPPEASPAPARSVDALAQALREAEDARDDAVRRLERLEAEYSQSVLPMVLDDGRRVVVERMSGGDLPPEWLWVAIDYPAGEPTGKRHESTRYGRLRDSDEYLRRENRELRAGMEELERMLRDREPKQGWVPLAERVAVAAERDKAIAERDESRRQLGRVIEERDDAIGQLKDAHGVLMAAEDRGWRAGAEWAAREWALSAVLRGAK